MNNRVLLILLTLFLGACASAGDVERQQARLRQQQQKLDNFEQIRPAVAQNSNDLEALKKRVSALEGRIDELQRRLEVPAVRQYPEAPMDPFAKREGAPADMEQTPQEPAYSMEVPTDTPSSVEPAQPVDSAQALYDQALKQFNERKFQAAQATWKQFAEQHKDNPLVPNALFWQGESFYQLRDYPKAILAYQEVIGKYPKSTKYPASLLKQGISFIIIGKKEAGRLVLNDVIKKFPDSPEAKRAEEFLSNAN